MPPPAPPTPGPRLVNLWPTLGQFGDHFSAKKWSQNGARIDSILDHFLAKIGSKFGRKSGWISVPVRTDFWTTFRPKSGTKMGRGLGQFWHQILAKIGSGFWANGGCLFGQNWSPFWTRFWGCSSPETCQELVRWLGMAISPGETHLLAGARRFGKVRDSMRCRILTQ